MRPGTDSVAGFVAFAKGLRIEDGRALDLKSYQRDLVRGYFGGALETVAILGKGNGKTTELAALALHHMDTTRKAAVDIAAASEKQAAIMYRQARLFVEGGEQVAPKSWRLGRTTFKVREGTYEIRSCRPGEPDGLLRVIPGTPETADGAIPTLAIVDELHRHKSPELYATLHRSLRKRNGRMVTISTAGNRLDSPLGLLRAKAWELPNGRRIGAHFFASTPGFVFHEWSLSDEEDPANMRHVKRANPAPWYTLETLRVDYDSPTTNAAEWARFVCGIWTSGSEVLYSGAEWDALAVDVGGLTEGDEVYAALRIGYGRAAIGLASRREPDRVAVGAVHLRDITLAGVEAAVRFVGSRYSVRECLFDNESYPYANERLPTLNMVEAPQRAPRLAQSSATFHELIRSGRVAHDRDDELRRQVLLAATKESDRSWRYLPTPDNHALIAVAMAAHEATQAPTGPYLYMGRAS